MSLPVRLIPGMVSIYGTASLQGIDLTVSPQLQFGVVDQVYDDFGLYQKGENVLFKPSEADMVKYQDRQFYLLPEVYIILIEDPLIPPP